MNPCLRALLFAAGSTVMLVSGAGADDVEIHTCVDPDGNIVLQTDPCPEPPPAPPKPAPPARKPKAAPRPAAARPAAAETETETETSLRMQSAWIRLPPAQRSAPVSRRRIGPQTFPTSLTGSSATIQPSFVTPERTWHTFLTAIESGDRTAAVACFTPAALQKIGPDAESFPLDEIRMMVGRLTRIEDGGDLGPLWSIYGVRASRRPKWIFFEETGSGEWKIAGI